MHIFHHKKRLDLRMLGLVIFLGQEYEALTFLVVFTFKAIINLRKRVLKEKSIIILFLIFFFCDLGFRFLRILSYLNYKVVFFHRLNMTVCLDTWLR